MCVSVNRPNVSNQVTANYKTNNVESKILKDEPLNLDLPKDSFKSFSSKDEMSITNYPSPNRINYPSIPIYQDPESKLRIRDVSPNSAKIEYGEPGEKALVTIKVRNEEYIRPFGGNHVESKASIDSPYLRDKAGDFAKDTVMNNVVEPLRNAIGKTAADTTLGAAAVATALVAAKHLPDGHTKIDMPIKGLTGDENLKARMIVGFGEGKNLKPVGFEVRKRYELDSQNFDVKASYRKDAEINGVKGVDRAEIEATLTDKKLREDSGALAMRVSHDKVIGTSVGIVYNKKF